MWKPISITKQNTAGNSTAWCKEMGNPGLPECIFTDKPALPESRKLLQSTSVPGISLHASVFRACQAVIREDSVMEMKNNRELQIHCAGFVNNELFPLENTGRGKDISPEFTFTNLSPLAKTVAITLEDKIGRAHV